MTQTHPEDLPTVRVGDSFHFNDRPDDGHLYFLASDTREPDVVVMNFTTVKRWTDGSCLIEPGEHEFVERRTCVAYEHAEILPTRSIRRGLQTGTLTPRGRLSNELLQRVWDGAQKSRFLPLKCKAVLREQSLIR